jgi:cytochrome c oxidase subunit 2
MHAKLGKLWIPAGLGAWLWPSATWADWGLNMTEGVTPISKSVYDLHMLILWICVAIGVVVFAAMFWSFLHFRKSKGAVPAQFHESTTLEVVWTIIPFLILIGIAIPATKTLVAMEDATESELTIKITGYQWMWHYDYLDEGFGFFSSLADSSNTARQRGSGVDPFTVEHYLLDVDNPLVLPTNTKVRLLTTGADVIHAWWVPALGWKRDAIPGFVNENWVYIKEPGTYRGQCAELCGKDHGFMPIVVIAKTPDEYRQWLDQAKQAAEDELASAPTNDGSMPISNNTATVAAVQ